MVIQKGTIRLAKYIEIIDYISSESKNKNIKAGKKLPSIRELADKFNCSTVTVARAYKELELQHLIYSVPKSGYYLVSKHFNESEGDLSIDFSTVLSDMDIIPYDEFHHCIDHAMKIHKSDLFTYGDSQGLPALVSTIEKHLQDYQVFCKSSQIAITAGSQQAVNILTKLNFPNCKKNILVENPTYDRLLQNFKMHDMNVIGIDRNFNGIDMDKLEMIFREKDIKFFYTVPRFHNPLGSSYSMSEKKEILRLAQKYDVYIVEDDYLVDLDTSSSNDPIYSLDTEDRVIYLKTFSKILLPGLRIAAAVLPKFLMPSFLTFRQFSDIHTSTLSQGALDIYIKNGMFKMSKLRLKKTYADRMAHLKKICNDFEPSVLKANIPDTGFFLSLESKNPINFDKLLVALAKKGIIIKDARECFLTSDNGINLIKISISRTDKQKISAGMNEIYNYFSSSSAIV